MPYIFQYMIKAIIKSLRPHQWVKNTFVFAGVVFSGYFLQLDYLLTTIYAFIVFCMAASGVYLFNDILDKNNDTQHPIKRFRPIASGNLPLPLAYIMAFGLWICSGIWSYFLNTEFFILIIAYIILHILYTIWLKKIVIWDLMAVSAGFVLRAVGGAFVINVEISSWLLVCTSLLALFLITAKRRAELSNIDRSKSTRPVLKKYSMKFLDSLLIVLTAATMTAYTLYVFSPETIEHFGTRTLGLTIPFVFYGIFRYLYLIFHSQQGENPEKVLFKDKSFLINITIWIIMVILIIIKTKQF